MALLNLDVGEFVKQSEIVEVKKLTTSAEHNFQVHLHLTGACVEHDAELRKANAALCKGNHNAALLQNSNQSVAMAVQEDNFENRCEYCSQTQRRSERQERTPGLKRFKPRTIL